MTSKPLPYESHVQALFAFAIGLISGAEGMRRIKAGEDLQTLEAPVEAYVFAGGALDEAAGDAFLEAKQQWFIVEMKRGPLNLKDELVKQRVLRLRAKLQQWKTAGDIAETALWNKSQSAHLFLYGARRETGALTLRTHSYVAWLLNGGQTGASDLVTLLHYAGLPKFPGFTWPELVTYLAAMNDKSGKPPSQQLRDLIDNSFAIAVNDAHEMTTHTFEAVMGIVNDFEKTRAQVPQQGPTAVAPEVSSQVPAPQRPRPGR